MEKAGPVKETMKASETRQNFSQVLNRVFRGDSRVLIEKSGIPVAAIVSARDLQRLMDLDARRAERFKVLEEIGAAFADVPAEEIEREAEKALAIVRARARPEVGHSPS